MKNIENIRISIIIPVYNVEQYIARCLTSVQKQTWNNLEILCIDDGSADRSGTICDRFAATDSRFRVFHKPNSGAAAARNMGLDHATGDYIGFVDSDDWIEPDMFEALLKKAVSLDADMCASGFIKEAFGKTYEYTDEGIEQDRPFSGEQAVAYAFKRYLYKSFANYNWSKLFKTELINNQAEGNLRYDSSLKMCEDTLFFVEAAIRAKRVTYIAKAYYHYDQREDSLVHDGNVSDRFCNLTAYQRVIELMEDAGFQEDTVNWAKRMYVYHASLILDLAARKKEHENVIICQEAIRKYLQEYIATSGSHEKWNERIHRMLAEPYQVAEESKINLFNQKQAFYTEQLALPILKNHVLYEASFGRGMICGPHGLFRAFMKRSDYANYTHVWVLNSQKEMIRLRNQFFSDEKEPENIVFVLKLLTNSKEYLQYLARCQYLFNNINFPFYFQKRPGQTYLNTWHGIPMKHLGYDVPDGIYTMHNNFRNFLLADYILGWNSFMTEVYRKSYKLDGIFTGEIIEEGCPRNDLTLCTEREAFLAELEEAGIRLHREKHIILYAPTWRGSSPAFPDFSSEEIKQFIKTVSGNLGQDHYQILFRPHHTIYKYVEKDEELMKYSIPPFFDTNEILSVTDILISDYSSIYFDFLVTGRPILFYIHDLEQYRHERGLYFGLERLPGPVLESAGEVAGQIRQLSDYQENYGDKYRQMTQWACSKDDGQVSRRVLEIVLDGNREGKRIHSDFTVGNNFTNGKMKVLVLYDKMSQGEKTERLLEELEKVDKALYDVTLIVREPKTDEEKQQMRHIPAQVRTLARVDTLNMTVRERKIWAAWIDAEDDAEDNEDLEKIYAREYARCVGEARFDYCIDGDGESFFTSFFCRSVKDAKRIGFADLKKVQEFPAAAKYRKEIPVVLSTDRNYLFQAFVVMAGVLKAADSGYHFHFYVITYDELAAASASLEAELKKHFTNFNLRIIAVNQEDLRDAGMTSEHLTLSTYNRLFIAELLPEWDKCVYLDCDLYVNMDIAEIYSKDMGDHYLLGVKDCHVTVQDRTDRTHRDILGLPSLRDYINAGVLVMNLAQMRTDNIIAAFKKQMVKENPMEDQDVLNVCCYGKIGFLPLTCNLFNIYYGNTRCLLSPDLYPPDDFDFDPYSPGILHMVNIYKPWNNLNRKGAAQWWELAALYAELDIYQEWREQSEAATRKADIRYMIEQCRAGKHVVIWGFTWFGKELAGILIRNGIPVHAICDNNGEFRHQTYRNIPVIMLAELDIPYQDIYWVVSAQKSSAQILRQLREKGVSGDAIYCYTHKKGFYYRSLDSRAYENELWQIMAREYGMEQAEYYYNKLIQQREEAMQPEYERIAKQYMFNRWLKVSKDGKIEKT